MASIEEKVNFNKTLKQNIEIIKFQQNITKYRFTSFKFCLQILSIISTNKVVNFLKCTRTLWTPCI